MMTDTPRQWMADQLDIGHSLCLILDSEGELDTRQALLKKCNREQYRSVYGETQIADLAHAGPFIFIIDNPDNECIKELLNAPERNWGWLASIRKGDLSVLAQHWRDRLIIGTRPNQALYRFHDNRVLNRALEHIAQADRAEYLGPVISVCYWQGQRWEVTGNPAPDVYPVPVDPAWLSTPAPTRQTNEMLHANVYRYLWAEHSDGMVRLSQRQDPNTWLAEQLSQALQWGWMTAEQLHFLILQNLNESEPPLIKNWMPRDGEAPQDHFERLLNEVKF